VNGERLVNVVVVDRDGNSRESIKASLTQMGVRVSGESENLASGVGLIKGLCPDILVLELPGRPEPTLELIHKLKNDLPEMGIILTSQDASPDLILRSMRVGAQEFLPRPINIPELAEAVRRLAGRQTARAERTPGKIITVFSNKGGVGVTSLATNLAVSFAKNAKMTTGLVDLNMQMAEVGLHLDITPTYTIADALGTGNLDETRLKGLLTAHSSGVQLLSTPEDPVEGEMISPGLLLEVFILLRGMFDVVIVDAGHAFDSRVLEVLGLADTILVVAGLDVPTVRNTRRCLSLFAQLGFTQDKVRLVLNRDTKKSKVTLEDLEETAGCPVFWQLPSDYKSLIDAIDSGVPAILQNPKSKISKSIEDLTYELCRLLSEEAPAEPAVPQEATGSGRRMVKLPFGR
jgi:pilus assembly protein CpaE